jgi:ATP-dependent DNA helicase RecG
VIAECKRHGAALPRFEELQGFLVVSFKAPMVAGGLQAESKVESGVESQVESAGHLENRVLAALRSEPLSKAQIAKAVGKKSVDGQLHAAVRDLVAQGTVEYTIPDKPNSRLQKYRLTPAVEKAMGKLSGEDEK